LTGNAWPETPDSAGETAVDAEDGDEAGVGGRTRRRDDQLRGTARRGTGRAPSSVKACDGRQAGGVWDDEKEK
jgi:hypothetical protein